ncbi:putative DnaJ domain, Thioredoxin-like superfamily, Chaperone J-domain superfamily [Helianthus annuus]|nr:putative DnaJ domain, Thioredoxin-like superfamily, Chaperone J-domain superfamily [Helianthus annuus]
MSNRIKLSIFVVCSLLFYASVTSKSLDPYKILGVEKDATQRQIQKAFHKLSLQYHPDKNKNKGAQEKFAEINNAYEILSDEEKRKNYDMFGDARGSPGFDSGDGGSRGGHTFFRSGGPGQSGFTFSPDDWQTMGGQQGGSKSYSFSFGGNSGGSSFGFDIGDVFSNFFGGGGGGMSGGFGGGGGGSQFGNSGGSRTGSRSSPKSSVTSVNSQIYKKQVIDKGVTWLLLSYTPLMKGMQHYESIIEEVASSLKGALDVGSVNCQVESSLCKELGIHHRNRPRVYVYSYKASESGSLLEYTGDVTVRDLKSFVQDHLPRFSKRVTWAQFEAESGTIGSLPKVMLLSTKKDTPVIWRALSGLYRKRFVFYDTQVQDASDPVAKKLGVNEVPAVVGWLSNGEKQVLKTGIHVKDMKSTTKEFSNILDEFEKKNKKIAAASSQGKKPNADSATAKEPVVPLLTGTNFDAICGEKTPVCIIGVFRSSKGREKLHTILSSVSQKSLVRNPRDSVSYGLLDASNQSSFLYAFDKSGFKSSDRLLIAYKPRKSKFSAFTGDITSEEVEKFIGSVLNGDVQFSKTRQKPTFK